jgi:predicted oxidoreductase
MNYTGIFDLTQILISKKFEKEIVFESSVLAWIRIRNRIRIEQKCWIRIRKKLIRIHNPGKLHDFFASQLKIAFS